MTGLLFLTNLWVSLADPLLVFPGFTHMGAFGWKVSWELGPAAMAE